MELRQLEHFVAVAGEMSFTRAADRAHVVQSALSTSIGKLERELGVALFDRSRQQIRLTAAGEQFRSHAHQVLQAARLATDSVASYRGSLTGTVEFGSLISFGALDVPRALGQFHRAHPFVRINLRLSQSGASAYLSSIADGSLDLALVSMPNRFPPHIDMRLLFEEPMVLVCRPGQLPRDGGGLDLADVGDQDLIGLPPGFGLRALMDNAFHSAGVQPHTRYEVPAGFSAIAELVRHGLGSAFMPVSEARRFTDLDSHALTTPVSWRVYLASPPVPQMSPATARLADGLLDAAAQLRSRADE